MSYLVWLFLNAKGYDVKFVGNKKHCFVIYDNYIIDLTAIQFNQEFDKVFIMKRCDYDFWKELVILDCNQDINNFLDD